MNSAGVKQNGDGVPNRFAHASGYYASRGEATEDDTGDDTGNDAGDRPALSGQITADVVVIGGGLAGLSTAWNLARRGIDVVLIEARLVGWGASGRNGGFVSPGFSEDIFRIEKRVGLADAWALYDLSRQGVGFVRDRITEFGHNKETDERVGGQGWLKVIRHGDTAGLNARRDRMARDYGATLAVWDRDRVRRHLDTPRYFGGIHDPEPFAIDPLAYSRALAASAEQAGCRIFERTGAVGLSDRSGRWRVETSAIDCLNDTGATTGPDCGHIVADHVVIATSAYGAGGRHAGLAPEIDRSILPVATHVVVTEPMGEKLTDIIGYRGCIADTRRAGDYFRLVGSGDNTRLLWGGRITTRRQPPADLKQRMAADIATVFPKLSGLPIAHGWSGLMGYTATRMPIIGPIRPRLWSATAFGGHGLNTTAMAGLIVADGIADGGEDWRRFAPFLPRMADRLIGGNSAIGRAVTQSVYWGMQFRDALDERRAMGSKAG